MYAAGSPALLARHLVERAADDNVVWLGSADGDEGLSDAIADEVSRLNDPPPVEVVVGSWDVPGARLLDVVAVMDRLRSPGGCPWDAEQTHESLLPYLEEEAGEYAEAVRSGDRAPIARGIGGVRLPGALPPPGAQGPPRAGAGGRARGAKTPAISTLRPRSRAISAVRSTGKP